MVNGALGLVEVVITETQIIVSHVIAKARTISEFKLFSGGAKAFVLEFLPAQLERFGWGLSLCGLGLRGFLGLRLFINRDPCSKRQEAQTRNQSI